MHTLRTLHLFAGAGGGILGDLLLGHHPVCAVEIESYCQKVLEARQKDGCLPWFPVFPDVTTFDGNPWRGLVDVVCGGFPCQDISAAGKGAGIRGERSGLWAEFARIVGEVQPTFVFVENSPMLTIRGLDVVLGDLATLGYDAKWGVFSAADVGAQHVRERIWILANANVRGRERTEKSRECISRYANVVDEERWGIDESLLHGVDDGLANRMERLHAIGNGQVPRCVALAWIALGGEINKNI